MTWVYKQEAKEKLENHLNMEVSIINSGRHDGKGWILVTDQYEGYFVPDNDGPIQILRVYKGGFFGSGGISVETSSIK